MIETTYDFDHPEEGHELLLDLIEEGVVDRKLVWELLEWVRSLKPKGDMTQTHIDSALGPLTDVFNKMKELDDALYRAACHYHRRIESVGGEDG